MNRDDLAGRVQGSAKILGGKEMDSTRALAMGGSSSTSDRVVAENRAMLEASGVVGINLVAAPGAGKTS
jgi:hypothetical protein